MEQKVVPVPLDGMGVFKGKKEMEETNKEIAKLNQGGWRVVQVVMYPFVGGDYPRLFALIQKD